LDEVPLHVSTLSHVCVLYTALLHLNFSAVVLLGKLECGSASTMERARLRPLNPTVKAFAAYHACAGIEECMAALGEQGYMEENDIGRLLRDAMVEKIWEGTINVLGLDLVRAVEHEAVAAWMQCARGLLADAPKNIAPQSSIEVVEAAVKKLPSIFAALRSCYHAPPCCFLDTPLLPWVSLGTRLGPIKRMNRNPRLDFTCWCSLDGSKSSG
jgi:hypothetical protein